MTTDSTPAPIGLLAGKAIVITGASTGIGAESARLFASEGASLMLGARGEDALRALTEELAATGADVGYFAGDISVPADAAGLIDAAVSRFGRLDGAFNNAGVTWYGSLIDMPEDEFDLLMRVNVKGTWLSMREEYRAIRATSGIGSIVNTASVAGYRGSVGIGAYPASKHAVIGLSKTLAREAGPVGIRVNVIAPGGTETAMMVEWREKDPEAVKARVAAIPFGRMNLPVEVAQQAAWLLSDRSLPLTGVTVPIDGGSSV